MGGFGVGGAFGVGHGCALSLFVAVSWREKDRRKGRSVEERMIILIYE